MSKPKSSIRVKSTHSRSLKQAASGPSHLYLKGNIYYLRLSLSPELRKRLGHSEFRLNLGTGYVRQARNLAGPLYCHLLQLLRGPKVIDHKEIKRRMNRYLQQLLDAEQNNFSPPINYSKLSEAAGFEFSPAIVAEAYARICGSASKGCSQDLSKDAVEILDTLLRNGVFTFDELTPKNPLLIIKTYLQTMSTYHKILAKRAEGDYIFEDHILMRDYGLLPGETGSFDLPIKQPPHPPSLLYSEAVKVFEERQLTENRWKKKTLPDHIHRLSCFLLIIGDKPLSQIVRDDLLQLRSTMQKLPPRWSRDAKYKGMTPHEIVASKPSATLNLKTINETIGAICNFLNWCMAEGKMDTSDITKRLKLKDARQVIELKKPFSNEELIGIFSHPLFFNGKYKYPAYFWVPVISLFTGMRVEEISQLHCKDLRQIEGIWVLDIKVMQEYEDDNDPKDVKTPNATRVVPIHSDLIDIGLLHYCNAQIENGVARLFPELSYTDKVLKYGSEPSKRFAYVVKKVLGEFSKKSFHSLRHTFADFYKQKGLMNPFFEEVFGHSHDTLAAKNYGGKMPPRILYDEIISKLDYGPKLLKVIKKSPFSQFD